MVIKTAIADDHPVMRKGLVAELKAYQNIQVIGEAADGDQALQLLDLNPDILLLDLNMPKRSGLEVLRSMTASRSRVKTLVCSMDDSEKRIVESIEAGAFGFVSKKHPIEIIHKALVSLMEVGSYLDELDNPFLIERLRASDQFSLQNSGEIKIQFSDREIEIMRCISQELSTSEIADKLSLSPRTVEGIRQDMIHKVGAKTVIGLMLYATRSRLI